MGLPLNSSKSFHFSIETYEFNLAYGFGDPHFKSPPHVNEAYFQSKPRECLGGWSSIEHNNRNSPRLSVHRSAGLYVLYILYQIST